MKKPIKSILFVLIPALTMSIYSCKPKSGSESYDQDSLNSKEVAEDRNDDKFNEKDTEKDAQFVVDAISANYAEIRLANEAEKYATDKEVKELAAMLVTQHTKLLDELKKYAASKVISVPTDETSSDEKNAEDLKTKKEFDKKWCADMKDMHEKTIKKFEDASNDLSDPELKNLAANALPEIRRHYDKIVTCHDRLK